MQKEYEKIELRSEEVQEILGEVPVWVLQRGIAIIAIIIIIIIAGSAYFKYPDIITSSITLTSTSPAINIVAKSSGRIQELYIKDNDYINENDYLAVIENSAKTYDIKYLKNYLLSIRSLDSITSPPTKNLKVGNLQSLYSSFYLTLSEYIRFKKEQYYFQKIMWTQAQLDQYSILYKDMLSQKLLIKKQREIVYRQYKRDSILCIQKLLSEENLENSYNNYLQGKLNSENMHTSLNNMQLQIIQMNEVLSDTKFQYTEKKNELEIQINNYITQLTTEIQNWEINYAIIAPISGTVTFTQYWSKNQNIIIGEQVFNMVPNSKGYLIGKALLPVERSGKVKVGQNVNIHFTNFPENEFGFIKGKVKNISLVPSKMGNETNYIVEIQLVKGLKTSYNKELPYLPEMEGKAEIITEDLSLLERFFLPIKKILKKSL